MNWDSTWLTTKVFIFIALGIVLSIMNVVTSVSGATLTMAVLVGTGSNGLALLGGICVAVTLYVAGLAGRNYAMNTVPDFLFSKVELKEIDKVADDYESQKSDEE